MTLGFSHQSGTQVRPAAAGTVSKKEFERIVESIYAAVGKRRKRSRAKNLATFTHTSAGAGPIWASPAIRGTTHNTLDNDKLQL
jgi:hypothetical protein